MRISDWSSDVCSSDLPRATIIGTLATGLLYLIVCSAIALMLPAAEVATSEAPFSLFVETYWGHGPAVWIAAFAAVSALGALNGWTLIPAEQPARRAGQHRQPAVRPWRTLRARTSAV